MKFSTMSKAEFNRLLRASGHTHATLAKALGVTKQAVRNWASGETPIKWTWAHFIREETRGKGR